MGPGPFCTRPTPPHGAACRSCPRGGLSTHSPGRCLPSGPAFSRGAVPQHHVLACVQRSRTAAASARWEPLPQQPAVAAARSSGGGWRRYPPHSSVPGAGGGGGGCGRSPGRRRRPLLRAAVARTAESGASETSADFRGPGGAASSPFSEVAIAVPTAFCVLSECFHDDVSSAVGIPVT